MALQAWIADEEICAAHLRTCKEPTCETCATIIERQWQDEVIADERARREAEQDCEFNALVEAERNGDEPLTFDPNDEIYPSRA